ncbi:MAG TPA: multidrug effflux MFS transporter [Steroidobacteraceae bacterium]|nr:multidrug effflux MFS transporter [Steroidobacteraceae bacterium]
MQTRFLRNAITLGLLSAIGPFAIDMYLPALPAIAGNLHADTGAAQLSLTVFFIAVSLAQPFYGPLSDMIGRKPPLYIGLALFSLGSIGCALAQSIGTLIAFRFLQGLGACGGMVIPRAVVRDLHTGIEATRLMSLLMLVFSISPILAPLTGSFVIQAAGWRSVFWAVLAAAIIGCLILGTLAETRLPAERARSSIKSAVAAYGRLLRDRHFLALAFIGAFGISSFFIYLSNSPFVLIEHYHLSPRLYSVCFSINAASFFAVAQLNATLASRFGLRRLVRGAAMVYAAVMLSLLAIFALGVDRLDVLAVFLFVGYGALGLVLPPTTVLALEEHGAIAGTASALMGTVQFVTGAVLMSFVGTLLNGTAFPMVAGIAGCAAAALILSHFALRSSTAGSAVTAEGAAADAAADCE